MTTTETIKKPEELEEKLEKIKVGDIFVSKEKGKEEIVTEVFHEDGKLVRFKTAKREKDGAISELGYSINRTMGRIDQSYAGIFYGDESYPLYHSSKRYFELNEFLNKFGK